MRDGRTSRRTNSGENPCSLHSATRRNWFWGSRGAKSSLGARAAGQSATEGVVETGVNTSLLVSSRPLLDRPLRRVLEAVALMICPPPGAYTHLRATLRLTGCWAGRAPATPPSSRRGGREAVVKGLQAGRACNPCRPPINSAAQVAPALVKICAPNAFRHQTNQSGQPAS